MGGKAFGPDGLHTPRMPPAVYYATIQKIQDSLVPLFEEVALATDAPEKIDHGDVDVLVLPRANQPLPSTDDVAALLNAERWYDVSSNGVRHLAIPWPEEGPSLVANNLTQSVSALSLESKPVVDPDCASAQLKDTSVGEKRYVQLDLRICSSKEDLNWRLFAHGHGDLVNIVSSVVRHKGLTITDQALYLRIQGLDTQNKKLKRIELSRDPIQVMQFLGVDPARFYTPFATLDEMMSYISTCRFYDPTRLKEAIEEKRLELTRASLNSRDKDQLAARPIFRYWYETFLPAHENDPASEDAHFTRDQVNEAAFSFFGNNTKQQYESRKHEISTVLKRDKLWSDIQAHIRSSCTESMTEKDIHETLRALRREIVPNPLPLSSPSTPANPSSSADLTGLQKAYLTNDFATVRAWALTNHAAALSRWRAFAAQRQVHTLSAQDELKANRYSKSELEMYTEQEDEVIVQMKREEATWGDILAVLGKTSKSQLMAHWKRDLQQRGEEESGCVHDLVEQK